MSLTSSTWPLGYGQNESLRKKEKNNLLESLEKEPILFNGERTWKSTGRELRMKPEIAARPRKTVQSNLGAG